MAVQIQLRGDTYANWSGTNPTMAQREFGVETDTNKIKIGDGVTAWNSLPYFSPAPVFPQELIGIFGQEEGVGLGTGTILNVVGAGATLSLSGTVLNLNIPGGGAGGGVDQIGIYGQDEGINLGTGTVLNIVGAGAVMTLSGTVLNLSIPGGGGGGYDGYGVSVYDDDGFKVSGTALVFEEYLSVDVTGSFAYINVTGTSSGGGLGTDGWASYDAVTPTRVGADDPTYTLQFDGVNLTGTFNSGMRIKGTQNSIIRYGIITSSPTFVSGTTAFNVLTRCDDSNTDYDIEDTGTYAISNFNYSPVKAPFGFDVDPIKWTIEETDSSNNSQSSPTQNQWYNLGSFSIDIPIGSWKVQWKASIQCYDSNSGFGTVQTTLSTANNSESDSDFTVEGNVQFTGPTTAVHIATPQIEKYLLLASKTTYYLNTRTRDAGLAQIYNRGDLVPQILKATCAYL